MFRSAGYSVAWTSFMAEDTVGKLQFLIKKYPDDYSA